MRDNPLDHLDVSALGRGGVGHGSAPWFLRRRGGALPPGIASFGWSGSRVLP